MNQVLAHPVAVQRIYQPYAESNNPYRSAKDCREWYLDGDGMLEEFLAELWGKTGCWQSEIMRPANQNTKLEDVGRLNDEQKIMLLGIAVILAAIALSINNIIAFGGGIAGLLIAIIGLFIRDKDTKSWVRSLQGHEWKLTAYKAV